MCLSGFLSVYVWLAVYQFVSVSFYQPALLFLFVSLFLSLSVSDWLARFLSFCLAGFLFQSVWLSVCVFSVSGCLGLFLFVCFTYCLFLFVSLFLSFCLWLPVCFCLNVPVWLAGCQSASLSSLLLYYPYCNYIWAVSVSIEVKSPRMYRKVCV